MNSKRTVTLPKKYAGSIGLDREVTGMIVEHTRTRRVEAAAASVPALARAVNDAGAANAEVAASASPVASFAIDNNGTITDSINDYGCTSPGGFEFTSRTGIAHSDVKAVYERRFDSSDDQDFVKAVSSCSGCGYPDADKILVQCDYCAHWIHIDCYNSAIVLIGGETIEAVYPDKKFCCTSTESCLKIHEAAYRKHYINNDLGLVRGAPVDPVPVLRPSDGSGKFSEGRATFLDRGVESLDAIKRHNRLTATSIRMMASQGIAVNRFAFEEIIQGLDEILASAKLHLTKEQKEAFRRSLPPIDVRRAALPLHQDCIKMMEFVIPFADEGVEVVCRFHYIDPTEMAASLYFSRGNDGFLPPFPEPRCSSGRQPTSKNVKQFCESMGFEPTPENGHVVVEIGWYSDASHSASGNVEFTPIWLFLAGQEPSYRFVQKSLAHGLIAILPDAHSVFVRYTGDEDGKASASARNLLSFSQINNAVDEIRKRALEFLFSLVASKEQEGLRFVQDSYAYVIHPLVRYYICDMKERRSLLPIRGAGWIWDCTHCYSFPGVDRPDQKERGNRTLEEDEAIRRAFKNDCQGQGKSIRKEQFAKDYGFLGVPLQDDSPFTRKGKGGTVFWTLGGPYEVCLFDALHAKDGIIEYTFKWVARLIGSDFKSQTIRFGNAFLETGDFHFHVMEKSILSVHSLPLAVMLGDFKNAEITPDVRLFLYSGLCDLLEVLNLLTDPCPAFTNDLLGNAIKSFEIFIRDLVVRIELSEEVDPDAKDKTKKAKKERICVTTKMHELFTHAVEHGSLGGAFDAFSTKLFETFMKKLKDSFEHSSKQRDDGTAYRGMLEQFLMRQVVAEQQLRDNGKVRHQRTELTIERFKVANHLQGITFRDLLMANIKAAAATLFDMPCTDPRLDISAVELPDCARVFGSTLIMWIENPSTNAPESNEVKAGVPGVVKSDDSHNGNFHRALVYKDPGESVSDCHVRHSWDKDRCYRTECDSRHHDPNFQLFCSAVRRADDRYCIPLIFMEDSALVWNFEVSQKANRAIPSHPALFQVECQFKVSIIKFKWIRGTCLFRRDSRFADGTRCFIWPGRGTYGFNILQ